LLWLKLAFAFDGDKMPLMPLSLADADAATAIHAAATLAVLS